MKMVDHVRHVLLDLWVKLVWMAKTELRVLMVDLVFLADLEKEASRVLLGNMDHLARRVLKDHLVVQASVVTKETKAQLKHSNSRVRKAYRVCSVSKVILVKMDVQVTMA